MSRPEILAIISKRNRIRIGIALGNLVLSKNRTPPILSIMGGLGLLSGSMSGEHSHLKNLTRWFLFVLYVPIHLCKGSAFSDLRKLSRYPNRLSRVICLKDN
jgi:hypothetical protein